MLTLEQLKQMPPGTVFARGELPNSPEGLFMTRGGGILRWLAKRGYNDDWAIYCHWASSDWSFIETNGDKIFGKENILKCVKADEEALTAYRK